MSRRMTAPLSADGEVTDYEAQANVQLVQSIFPASEWASAFPYANSVYTHEGLMRAVAKFPAFCNETNLDGWTLE